MGRRGASKRKPEKDRLPSNADANGASRTRAGEHWVAASPAKDIGAPLNTGSANPSAGVHKNRNEGG